MSAAEKGAPAFAQRSAEDAREFEAKLRSHASHERLTLLIDHCVSEGLIPDFASWDTRANDFQHDHRRLVRFALWGGAVGALLGIVRFLVNQPFISYLEAASFIIAGLAVGSGLRWSRRDRWLLARYEAERRRLKLFELAADPVLWMKEPPPDWKAYVKAGMDALPRIPDKGIESLGHAEHAPRLLHPDQCRDVARKELTALVNFCRSAHLDVQTRYFEAKVRDERRHRMLHEEWVAYLFFTLVLLFAFLHVGLEFLSHAYRPLSMLALSASAAVAGIWAAVRTWRSANEFSRNAARAEAKLTVLQEHCGRLEKELVEQRPDPWTVFMTLALCDAVLQGDQREWLALMHEAEWF